MAIKLKPKRMLKPKITAAIEIVRSSLSFLNSGWSQHVEIDGLCKRAFLAFQQIYPALNNPKEQDHWVNLYLDENSGEYLIDTWFECARTLKGLITGQTETLMKREWIDDALKKFTLHLSEEKPLELQLTAFPPIEKTVDGLPKGSKLPGFRANLVKAIFEAFGENGGGNDFFGECRACTKMFFRKQATVEFCQLGCKKLSESD